MHQAPRRRRPSPSARKSRRGPWLPSHAADGREVIHRVIYLHKILPVFVLPVGITLLLVLAGLRLRRRWLIWSGVAVLWLSSTPLISAYAVRATEGWAERG